MKIKHIKKFLLLVAITILLVGLVTAATTNKTNTNKDTKIIKDNTKNIKTAPTTTKKATTKTITNNKTQTNKEKEEKWEKTTQKIEKNKQKNKKTETEQTVTDWTTLNNTIEQITEDTTIKLEKGLYITTEPITWNKTGKTLTIDGNGQTINGNQKQVFRIEEGSTLHLKNITIANAQTTVTGTGIKAGAYGGAIYNSGNLTITDSTLTNNTANATGSGVCSEAIGGAIYNTGTLTITDSTLTNNTANATLGIDALAIAYGGAIYNNGTLTINNSALQNNQVTATGNQSIVTGGAISNNYGTLTITHSTFTYNTANATGTRMQAEARGGAIYAERGINNITHTTLNNNKVTAATAGYVRVFGGAISNTLGKLDIRYSQVENNQLTATGTEVNIQGGAIYKEYGNYNITDTIFYKNTPVNFIINDTKNIQLINKDNYISIVNFTILADGEEIGNGTKVEDLENFIISDEYRNVEIIINGTDDFTLNNRYMLRGFSIDVHNYTELVRAIKKAQSENYDSFLINLKEGDYNATTSINLEESETKNLIINGNNIILDGKHEHQFIRIGEGLNLTLNNITITNYNVTVTEENNQDNAMGGAIYNIGTLIINNSTLQDNKANAATTRTGDYAYAYAKGGAIYNSGTLTITDSTLTNNTVNATAAGGYSYAFADGGAIYNSGTLTINNSTLQDNKANAATTRTGDYAYAYANGGAIYNFAGTLIINNSTLQDNKANAATTRTGDYAYSYARGGAIYNFAGTLIINNSTLQDNKANAATTRTGDYVYLRADGGAIYNNMGTLNVNNSTLTNNKVTASTVVEGGAIYNWGGNYNITDTTFYKNTPANFIINDTKNIQLVNEDYISIVQFSIIADGKVIGTGTSVNNLTQFTISDEYNNVEIIINGSDDKTINNHYILRKTNITEVHNYTELVEAIKTAQSEAYDLFIINLRSGNYNATQNIIWEESATKNLIINGSGLILDGNGRYQFILVGSRQNLTLNNVTITNYTAKNGGAVESYGNLTILNSNFAYNTATERGGAIYLQGSDDEQIMCKIVGNRFEGNRAKEETIYLNNTLITTIKDNTYKNTTIEYDFVLTIDSSKTEFLSNESLPLKYNVSLVHPTFYDENLLDNIDKLTYEISIENGEKINATGLSANIKLKNYKGKYTAKVYNDLFQTSNPVEFTVTMPTSIKMKVINNTMGNVIINVDVKDINEEYVTSGVLKVYNKDKEIASIQLKGKSENITLDIDKGEQKLKLEYKANSNDYYLNSTLTDKVTIISATSITLKTKNIYVGDSIVFNGTLKDSKGRGLNTNITVTINNKKETVKVTDGKFQIKYTATKEEKVKITVEFPGDKYNLKSNLTKKFKVKKLKTIIIVKDKKIQNKDKVKLMATVKDQNNKKVTAGKVIFKINGITIKDKKGKAIYVNVSNGKAILTITPNKNYYNKVSNITAVYSENSKYLKSENKTAKLTLTKRNAKIKLLNTKIKTTTTGTITLKTQCTDKNKKAIKEGYVIFKLNGKTLTKNGTTVKAKIKNGIATLKYKLDGIKYGKYNLTAVLSSNTYKEVTSKTTLKVNADNIHIDAKPVTTSKNKTRIKAKILDAKNKYIKSDIKVSIKINQKTVTQQVTIQGGKINILTPTNVTRGNHTLTFVAGPNDIYKVTRKDVTLTKI